CRNRNRHHRRVERGETAIQPLPDLASKRLVVCIRACLFCSHHFECRWFTRFVRRRDAPERSIQHAMVGGPAKFSCAGSAAYAVERGRVSLARLCLPQTSGSNQQHRSGGSSGGNSRNHAPRAWRFPERRSFYLVGGRHFFHFIFRSAVRYLCVDVFQDKGKCVACCVIPCLTECVGQPTHRQYCAPVSYHSRIALGGGDCIDPGYKRQAERTS